MGVKILTTRQHNWGSGLYCRGFIGALRLAKRQRAPDLGRRVEPQRGGCYLCQRLTDFVTSGTSTIAGRSGGVIYTRRVLVLPGALVFIWRRPGARDPAGQQSCGGLGVLRRADRQRVPDLGRRLNSHKNKIPTPGLALV